jgi:nucleoid-associated protein YgaU
MLHTDGSLEETIRWAAAVLAGALVVWHLAGLFCCAALRRGVRRHRLVAAARWAPPLARRLVGVAGLAGVASFTLVPVAAHAATGPAEEPFVRAPATGSSTAIVAPSTTVPPPTAAAPTAPAPTAPVTTAPATPAPNPALAPSRPAARTHVVARGDNLWGIARAEVARVTGHRAPRNAEVAPYWERLIAANRTTLRSGDPSLIYPGEVVALPD